MSITITFSGETLADALHNAGLMLTVPAPFVGSTGPQTNSEPLTTSSAPQSRGGRRSAKDKVVDAQPAAPAVAVDPQPAVQTEPALAAAPAEPEKKLLTLDDVRAAAAPYIKKFTIAAAQEDLQYALDAAVGKRTMSALDDKNQDELAKAVAAFDAAAAAEARFPKPADWK